MLITKEEEEKSPLRMRSNEGQFKASLNNCWLRDSEESSIQEWLRKKDQMCQRERRTERRKREKERREMKEKARKQAEKNELAKIAYQEWLERKKRRRKDSAPQIKTCPPIKKC